MADDENKRARLRSEIADIARRPKQVSLEELERIINRLQDFHSVQKRKARHGYLCRVADKRFMINSHNPGDSHVKAYSVKDFLIAMIDLGWYEGE